MPKLFFRMPNSAVECESSGAISSRAPLLTDSSSQLKLSQSNGHVNLKSFIEEDEDADADELYLDAVDRLSPEDDLRKLNGTAASDDVTTSRTHVNKDNAASGSGKHNDDDQDDTVKMEVSDRFGDSRVSRAERHFAAQKQPGPAARSFDSSDSPSADDSAALKRRRLRFSVRTVSEGVDPEKEPSPPRQSSVVFHPVPPVPISLSSYRTDSLATIANVPSTTTQSISTPAKVTSDYSQAAPSSTKTALNYVLNSVPSSTSSVHRGKPPLRPSILKSSPFVTGGHRRTCPKSQVRHRNMSGDIHSATANHGPVSSNDPRRWRLFGAHSEEDPPSRRYHAESDCPNLDEHFFDAPTDLTGQEDPLLLECTCHLDPPPPAIKSVHILTPTKSEEILFDPAKSVASSIISINKLNRHSFRKHKHHQNHQLQEQPQHVNNNNTNTNIRAANEVSRNVSPSRLPVVSPASALCPSVQSNDFKDGPIQMLCAGEDEESHSFTPLITSHHKSASSNASSDFTEVLFLEDQEQEQSPYRETVINVGFADKMACGSHFNHIDSSSRHHHHHQSSQLISHESCDSDDDDDNPQYCKRCDIWFGSFDPSYPFRCNCNREVSTGGTGGTDTLNTNDTVSIYSMHMQKDFRYFLQHPYARLFVAYFVIFCNFFIFAEDPLSHSLRECSIPVLGNVISFLFTKYPAEVEWQLLKGFLGLVAIIAGLFVGKYFCHHFLLRRLFRLKMFRDESGTWMIMLITTVLIGYVGSKVYNIILRVFHPEAHLYLINSRIGLSFATFMKVAACGTWLGDFFTAWMITDMMLQDNLYPEWAPGLRRFWHKHTTIRIVIFWSGALVIATIVITIILTDAICWDHLSQGLSSTTELSRAYVASCILFMDLLIVMQDWDFPHFVSDLNIKLPGMLRPSYTLNFCRKSVKFPATEIKVSGKWFNYGIIVFVMMLDLNLWKNNVIYYPADFGQYVHPKTNRVYTVNETAPVHVDLNDPELSNYTTWTYEQRANRSLVESDLVINSRYMGYSWYWKASSFIPIAGGFSFFFTLIYLYGRFPPKTDRSLGGRLKKRAKFSKSSWRRERRDSRGGHVSWPGITVYDDPNRLNRINHYTLEPTMSTPCRPTAVFFNRTMPVQLPSSQPSQDKIDVESQQSADASATCSVPCGNPPLPADCPLMFSAASSPLSDSTSSSYHRLLPKFNGHVIWASFISALSMVNKNRSNGKDGSIPNATTEWVAMESNDRERSPNSPVATIVALPPFHPETMLQFQTKFVQLPPSGPTQVKAT